MVKIGVEVPWFPEKIFKCKAFGHQCTGETRNPTHDIPSQVKMKAIEAAPQLM